MFAALNGRFAHGFFDQLADHVELSFKLRLVQHVASNEHLAHEGLGFTGLHADRIALDRHVTPSEQPCALLFDDLAEQVSHCCRAAEREAETPGPPVFTGSRQAHAGITGCTPQELMRTWSKVFPRRHQCRDHIPARRGA